MYRCKKCNQLSQSGEAASRVVTETRTRTYQPREFAMRKGRGNYVKWIADPGGVGVESVREELWHERCRREQLEANEENR